MLDRNFIATRHIRKGGWLHSLREANAETREVVGYALEDKVLERTPLKDAEVSMLFTYMHRRFGQPFIGGDSYKDLTAGWLITTPVDDLALLVNPSFSGLGFSFIPYVVRSGKDRTELDDLTGERLQRLVDAYERTLLDLLRPVIQRDQDFNVLGEIWDENPVPEWALPDEDEEEMIERLPRYHETCGLPMPDGVFGNKSWQQVLTLFGGMGGGDFEVGMAAFVAEAEARALEKAVQARPDIFPIIAAGFYLASADGAKDKVRALGIEEGDPRVSEFCRASYGDGFAGEPSEWIMQVSETDILESAEHVAAFGIETHRLTKAATALARAQRQHIEWGNFRTITGGEFDEKLIPEVRYITLDAVDEWRLNLARSGDPKVSAWADTVAADPVGLQTLAAILSHLHFQKQKAAQTLAAPSS
ncbi:hypothetical protein G6L37_05140 [Agrobacterium rubi]|nr:hypothetical protein [Agrobacterium rubi]NTF24741.1 hypothetical protein [Agrobacterium rubi]